MNFLRTCLTITDVEIDVILSWHVPHDLYCDASSHCITFSFQVKSMFGDSYPQFDFAKVSYSSLDLLLSDIFSE